MKFFDTTPTGRILNRFSKDMDEGISLVLSFMLWSPTVFTASSLAWVPPTPTLPPNKKRMCSFVAPVSENSSGICIRDVLSSHSA